jgi:hypothetical protein
LIVKTNFGPIPTGQNILRERGRELNRVSSTKLTRHAHLEVPAKRGAHSHVFSWAESNSRDPSITMEDQIYESENIVKIVQ